MAAFRKEGAWTMLREGGVGRKLARAVPAVRNAPVSGAVPGHQGARVLLLGGDSDWNLGDQAIQYAVCHALSRAQPGVRITVTSDLPWREVAARRLPNVVAAVPLRASGTAALVASAARQDLVLLSGGGLFQDDDSRVKMPYWALRLALLRRACSNIRGLSIGAGPLQRPESCYWGRRAVASLAALSVRDPFAAGWMTRCLRRPVPLVPDPAFLVPPAPRRQADALLRSHGVDPAMPLIGIAMRRWFHPRGGVLTHRMRFRLGLTGREISPAMLHCLDQLAAALRQLAAETGARLLFLPSYPLPHEGDVDVCEALASRLPDGQRHVLSLRDPALYKAVAGRLALMVSGRMHPLILVAGMGVPGVGLGYNGKFQGLYDMLGMQPRVVPLERFRAGGGGEAVLGMARAALVEDRDLVRRTQVLADQVQSGVESALATVPAYRQEVRP